VAPTPEQRESAVRQGEASLEGRALSRSVGIVFQVTGVVLAIGGCCLWSLSGKIQPEIDAERGPDSLAQWIAKAPPGQVCAAIGIAASFLAGMAFLAVGMGLTAERRYSGRAAMIGSGAFTVVWLVETGALAVVAGSVAGTLLAIILAALGMGLFLLAGAAARDLKLHPPPPDLHKAPADYVDPLARRRGLPEGDDE
jgi:hypothetical protein